jgi:hypothetical protein
LTIVARRDIIGVEVMEMAKEALAKKYRFSMKSLEILEWARNRRAELHYLHPEETLIRASERAKKTRARLWSVSDEEARYFHFFPRPVNAVRAFWDFFKTTFYDEEELEGYPALVVPYAFEVEAWDARRLRKDEDFQEELEWMRKYWFYSGWPFKGEARPKVDSFFAIGWFTKD